MNVIINNWRTYVAVPSGETIRAMEIFVLTAIVLSVGTITSPEDVKTYAIAAALAGVNAAVSFLKGKVKGGTV